jgi:hypothetical protein
MRRLEMINRFLNVGLGLGGAYAARLAGNYNATWGPPAALAAVGYFGNNETLLTLAGMSLSNLIPLPGGNSSGGGGWY